MELGWGKRWLEERFEEGGDAGGVHGEPGEILAGVIAEVWFISPVSRAYRDCQISLGKGAEYLMIDDSEFAERFGDIYAGVEE